MSWNPLPSSTKTAFNTLGPFALPASRAPARLRPGSALQALLASFRSLFARNHELPLEKIARQVDELHAMLIAQRFRPIASMLADIEDMPIDQQLAAMRMLQPLLDDTVTYHASMRGHVSPPGLIVQALMRLASGRIDPAARALCVRFGLALVAYLSRVQQAEYLRGFQLIIGRLSMGDQLPSFRTSLSVSMDIQSEGVRDPGAAHSLVDAARALPDLHDRAFGKAAIDLLRAAAHVPADDREAVVHSVVAALRTRSAAIGVERHSLLPGEERFALFEELLGHAPGDDMGVYTLLLAMMPRLPARVLGPAQQLMAVPRLAHLP
jgi:hypothetical protein